MRGGDVIDVESRVVGAADETALVVTPHPMTVQSQRVYTARQAPLYPGETLAVFLARSGVERGQQWAVSIGGVDVQDRHWHLVRPKNGHLIEARRVPGKQVIYIVALLVLSYFTFGAAGMGAGGLFASGGAIGGGFLAAGAVFLAGSMVLNKLLGPKAISDASAGTTSPSYSLTGGRNRARQFEPMALVLGQPYCVPDLSVQPYVFFNNDEQYLFQVFHGGINCAAVDSISFGSTALTSYEGVTLSYAGLLSGNTGIVDATSVDTVAGGLLDAPDGVPGAWVTRTTSVGAQLIEIDLEFQLFEMNSKGRYVAATVVIDTQCRLVGTEAWQPLIDAQIVVTHSGADPVRQTRSFSLLVGQYEIRLRKETPNSTASTAQNVVSWTSLKTRQLDTGDYAGQARVGVKIKATGQLNGALDEVNWIATAKPMPIWNGTEWTTATNRANGLCNPGAQILLLARGIYDENNRLIAGLGMPDAQIDIEGLKGFMVFCTSKSFHFDYFLQETTSIGDLLDAIAAAGLGSRSWHTGKLGVIWFSDDEPLQGVLNMTTMKAKTFSVDYDTQFTAEEIEFQYFDRERGNAWQSIRVLAPGITSPASTARQQLVGVTTEAHAAILARFSMAQNVYQRKTVNCEIDLEHLVFRRGMVIALSHDITQWGYGGRLQGLTSTAGVITLQLDDAVPEAGPNGETTRYVGLRLPGEMRYRVFAVQAFSGSTRTVRLATAWPAGLKLPGVPYPNGEPDPIHDTLWIYDFKSTPGQRLRIADISPQGNMDGARLALVPELPEFWSYVWDGTYSPPPNNSLLRQDLPVARNLLVTSALQRVGDSWTVELTVNFDVAGNYGSAQVWASADGNPLERIGGDVLGGRTSWTVARGQEWTIEVRPFDTLGRMGTKASTTYHIAELPPDVVDSFGVTVETDSVVARWSVPAGLAAVDWSATQIRSGPSWEASTLVFEGRTDIHRLGWLLADSYTFWAAHRNTAGDWSTPVSATLTILPPGQPVVEGDMQGKHVQLEWQDCTATQPLRPYRVSVGVTLAGAAIAGYTAATAFSRLESEPGTRRYWIEPFDVAGNPGPPGYTTVESLPSIDEAMDVLEQGLDQVVDVLNNPETGLGATNIVAAAAKLLALALQQDVAILERRESSAGEALAETTLRTILKQHTDDGKQTAALAVARSELHTEITDVDGRVTAVAEDVTELAVQIGEDIAAAKSELRTEISEVDGNVTAVAEQLTELGAVVEDNAAAVNEQMLVLVEENGRILARWGVAVTVNGRVSGVVLNAESGSPSSFVVLADKFAVAFPSDVAGEAYPFIVGMVGGVPAVGINGNLFVDGSIIGRHLAVQTIEADNIKSDAIQARHIAVDQVEAQHMATDSITAENGAIKDLAVGTLKIAGFAVTTPVSAKTTGSIDIGAGLENWTTVQTASLVASGLGSIAFWCNADITPGTKTFGSGEAAVTESVPMGRRVIRGGTVISEGSSTASDSDAPGAGVWTYSFQVCHLVAPDSIGSARNRTINLLETKR